MKIKSEVARVRMVEVGVEIPCINCKKMITVESTADILCQFNEAVFGLCPGKCSEEFKGKAEKMIKERLSHLNPNGA